MGKERYVDDKSSMESMEALTNALNVEEPKRGDLRRGVIIDITDKGLIVALGAKRDGIVPKADVEKLGETFTVNQEIPVVVVKIYGPDELIELSVAQAREQEDWLRAEELAQSKAVYEGKVSSVNKGGLTVDFGRLRAFVPMSQLIGFSNVARAGERQRRLNALVGQTLMFKVVEVNRRRGRLILSQREAAKEWRAMRRKKLLAELQPGQVRTGRISQITNFGLFVNLGGLDGLVHFSELSWGRIENIAEAFKVGQKVKVKVLDVDPQRQRIALSIKALKPNPWLSVEERYQVGQLIEGKVSQVADFGVFVELEPGVEGLLHKSEISSGQLSELKVGDRILVKVIRIEQERQRISLSARQVTRQEWEQWAAEQQQRREQAAGAETREEAEAEEEDAEAVIDEMLLESDETDTAAPVEDELAAASAADEA